MDISSAPSAPTIPERPRAWAWTAAAALALLLLASWHHPLRLGIGSTANTNGATSQRTFDLESVVRRPLPASNAPLTANEKKPADPRQRPIVTNSGDNSALLPASLTAPTQQSDSASLVHAHWQFEQSTPIRQVQPVEHAAEGRPVAWLTGAIEPLPTEDQRIEAAGGEADHLPRIVPTSVRR